MKDESVKKAKIFTPRYKLLALLSTLKNKDNIIDKKEFIDEAEDILAEDFESDVLKTEINYYLEKFKRDNIIELSTLPDGTEIIKLNKQIIPYAFSEVINIKYLIVSTIIAFLTFTLSLFYALLTKIFEPLIVSAIFLFVSAFILLQYQRIPIIKTIKKKRTNV